MTRSLSVLGVALIISTTLHAADLSGLWSLELDPDFSGKPNTVGCGFTQNGDTLAIKCGGAESVGNVDGSKVTWQFMTGRNNATIVTFVGVLDEQARSIAGTWHMASDPPQDGRFKARRES